MLRRVPLSLPLVALACGLVIGLAACGGDDGGDDSSTTTDAAVETQVTDTGCERVSEPAPREAPSLKRPRGRLDADKTYRVTVATNCGSFTIELDVKRAPRTTASFAALVRDGFYDGLIIHRIVPSFVIQGGDPTGTGSGDPGYQVEEAPPEDLQYTRGVVAMAKGGDEPSGTSGSQFFVVTGEDAGLTPDYALVGRIVEGQDVVDAIGVVAVGPDERPVDPVVIVKATLEES